ncbi:ACT domain-containing protein [Microbulbifer sediminum]|uniref:ACT domain-containing protein n=1 Tax=Microbulbifer sediminum TaxID=2904250 RepID=UPI001F4782AF|nr:ACT domain-containing protein [Microbulbifer sediminum]
MNATIGLEKLLRSSEPKLHGSACVSCTLRADQLPLLACQCLLLVSERDGFSAIMPRELAEREGITVESPLCRISLTQRHGQELPGLLSALAGELESARISARITSTPQGHHLFVPEAQAQQTLTLLRGIGNRAQYC